MPILFRDYETCGIVDLGKVGAFQYTAHPKTAVLCCAYAIDTDPVKIWGPGDPVPAEFIEASKSSDWVISAFNDHFERLVEQHIMAPRHGWPIIPIKRHRCSQAAALSLALPAKLEKVALALSLEQQKDTGGRDNMLRMSRPRKPRKVKTRQKFIGTMTQRVWSGSASIASRT